MNRPNRRLRRQGGKSDAVDAEAAARAVLAGHVKTISGYPLKKHQHVEQIRTAMENAAAQDGRIGAVASICSRTCSTSKSAR